MSTCPISKSKQIQQRATKSLDMIMLCAAAIEAQSGSLIDR